MRIANANDEVASLTDAFVLAKNDLLRMRIKKKMGAIETEILNYIKELLSEETHHRLAEFFDKHYEKYLMIA